MEEISVKYAVYTTDDSGNDALAVSVDDLTQAKSEMESLKGTSGKIKINKCSVKNFGKENEQIINSETIDSWSNTSGPVGNGINDGGNPNMPPVIPPVIDSNAEPDVKKEDTWSDYYTSNGAIMGYSYGLKEFDESKRSNKKKNGDNDVVIVDQEFISADEFLSKGGSIGDFDNKFSNEIVADLKKAGASNIKFNEKTQELMFETTDDVDYPSLMEKVVSMGTNEFLKVSDNQYKMFWN